MIQNIRNVVEGVKMKWNAKDKCFHFHGDQKAIYMAKHYLQHTQSDKDLIVRVPIYEKKKRIDIVGRIIGKRGENIKKLKKQLEIQHPLSVSLDEAKNNVLLTSPVWMSPEMKSDIFFYVKNLL